MGYCMTKVRYVSTSYLEYIWKMRGRTDNARCAGFPRNPRIQKQEAFGTKPSIFFYSLKPSEQHLHWSFIALFRQSKSSV